MKFAEMLAVGMFAYATAQLTGGPVPTIPEILLGPRARAPLTILKKPIVADFQSVRISKGGDGGEVLQVLLRGRFFRDGRGYTRTEYYDPDQPSDSVALAVLWNPETRTMIFVSFGDRTIQTLTGPVYPNEYEWRPEETVVLKPTTEERIIHGLKCKRVLLVPRENPTVETGEECWISFEWGLVLLDVKSTATEEVRWEVARIQKTDPGRSVLNIPKGFMQK